MVTIKDIAQEAGVSTMMVSRVINKRYNQVSAENIERIEKIIKKYNYIPNSAAQSLSSKTSKIIAIFIQGDANSLEHPYNAVMLGYLIQNIQARGYDTMVHFISNYSDVCNKLQSWKASGAVFFGMFEKDFLQFQTNEKIPFVFTDCYSSSIPIANIGIDNYKGGSLAAQHLLDYGHDNFAIVGEYFNESLLNQQRLKGFCDTLSKAGINIEQNHIINFDSSTATKLIEIQQAHLAVFAFSDILSLKVIKQLNEHGYRVPDDFSIIGFDDLFICHLTSPELTTVSQNLSKKAEAAVDLLFQYLNYPDMPLQNIVLDVELVSRDTVKNLL
ncbi:MAG: LacI family transcriptional regulator [Lachnospiraceae bacterium]|nr:LacI family transcriptional regulator [Lachnospiraceae bacterium]